jgi:succinate dehydrogenase hydrophobic anchor subunit
VEYVASAVRDGHAPRREPGVEANARLTATTGLVLLVMLAAEGVTIASVGPLLPWHVGIGLALVPPVLLKMGTTGWRFARYYLGDPRYRRAGPPHPILRVAGPFVTLLTAAVLASGIAAWLAGPPAPLLMEIHKVTFVLWFGVMAVHVLGHTVRALRMVSSDSGWRARMRATTSPLFRRSVVAVTVVAGVVLGVLARGVSSGWTVWLHAR